MNKDFFNRKIVITADGSSSIYLPDFEEHYHSHHGAMQESKHVFMKMGWDVVAEKKSHIDVLEVGFGTGLNAWLVYDELRRNSKENSVHYTALELYPVALEDAAQLNFVDADDRATFLRLHEATWSDSVSINEKFTLEKQEVSLQDFQSARCCDLIFYDAFAPRVQPELWIVEIFQKLFSLLHPGGILVTYCAKGEVRRNMIAAGFTVEKLPGPPGKREMLRALKPVL
jgi:tRNA U34 5-methylaminomethyl-2-thiouridine-forming methyltransferase MnmC